MRKSEIVVIIGGTRNGNIVTGGKRLSGITGFQVVRAIDAASHAFAISTPWEPTPENIQYFKPYSPGAIQILGGDELFLEGYFEVVNATSDSGTRSLELQGRSTSGVLMDWSAGIMYNGSQADYVSIQPATAFEFQGLTFNAIAWKVSFPNLVYAYPDTGPLYDVAIEPGETVFEFLSKLAAANGLWACPQPEGSIIFQKIGGLPVASLKEGQSPLISIQASHDVTQRFYRYMIISEEAGNIGIQAIVLEKYPQGGPVLGPAIRGTKIIRPEKESTDYTQAANFARSRALIDAYSVTATVQGFTYKDAAGMEKFWKGGDIINLYAPGAFILKPSNLIVKQATFKLDESSGSTTTLELTLPEAYGTAAAQAALYSNFIVRSPWES